jgi:predicted RNA-binding Zn ribbon-like protein
MKNEADISLLIEVLDSTPRTDGHTQDRFADDTATSAWLAAHGLPHGSHEARELRRIRYLLQGVVRKDLPTSALSDDLHGVRQLPVLQEDGLHWQLTGADQTPARLVLAWATIEQETPGRLRPCENHDCDRFLLDRSRNNTGRWCSMEVCGNRMKARRHRARTAGQD